MKAVFLAVMVVFCLMRAAAAGKEAMDGTIRVALRGRGLE